MKKTADIGFCRSAHRHTHVRTHMELEQLTYQFKHFHSVKVTKQGRRTIKGGVTEEQAPWEGSEREPIMVNTYDNAIINPLYAKFESYFE